MTTIKETYVPTQFTLTMMQNFGSRQTNYRFSKMRPSQYVGSETKMPSFARKNKHAFDKQNLLEQIRRQKMRNNLMTASNTNLKRVLSKTKVKASREKRQINQEQKNGFIGCSLKREVELLIEQISKQDEQITKIKTSKKYNRFVELITMKEVYVGEIIEVKKRLKCFQYGLKQQKRVFKQFKKREKEMKNLNKNVNKQIMTDNALLLRQIQKVNEKISHNKKKQIGLERERQRLLNDIFQLQNKTGKMFIMKQQENQYELERPERQQQMNALQVKYKDCNIQIANSGSQEQDSSQQYQYQHDDYESENQEELDIQQQQMQQCQNRKTPTYQQPKKRLNVSF